MSDEPEPGLPFGFGNFDLGEVLRLLQSEGPLNFEVAEQVATWVATEGGSEAISEPTGAPPQPETRPDPGEAALMSELTRTAFMHVQQATGLGASIPPIARTMGRSEWAKDVLEGLAPPLTAVARRLGASDQAVATALPDNLEGQPEPDLGNLMAAMTPMLLGVQAGFMVGHLASFALARYEIPLPFAARPAVVFVGPNLRAFITDWDLPDEEVRFYVAIHEGLHAAMLDVPWVQHRLLALSEQYAETFQVDPRLVEERLDGIDPNDPASLQRALGNPSELLGAMRTPAQERVLEQLVQTAALLDGFADLALETIARPLIPAFDSIREACHRHRLERGEAAKLLETLLGFTLERQDHERAAAFCRGVVERGGLTELRRLFDDEGRFPTDAEIEAPGLWLERINLDLPTA